MEVIVSRQNAHIQHIRNLAHHKAYRREKGLFICDGEKLLEEAIANEAEIQEIYLRSDHKLPNLPSVPTYLLNPELFNYASPLENSPGPIFTVKIPVFSAEKTPNRVLVLENVQDPGNIGTVVRSAAAFEADLVVLIGECADPYNTKTVRASMGSLFRQPLWETDLDALLAKLKDWKLPFYGAALSSNSQDIRKMDISRSAVAIGNEGKGLSTELLNKVDGSLIIPMNERSESLNAAVAASVVLWEMAR